MKNLTKKTQTILFASLIAAIILPLSGMMMAEAAPNGNANKKALRNFEVEVLSKEIISETEIDGVKVTKFKQIVKQTDLPTVKDFKDESKEYFDFLVAEFGEEGKKLVAQEIAEFAKNRANAKEVYEIETTKVGDHSITFEAVTRDGPGTWANQKDPINMIFWYDGRSSEVKSKIDNNAPHSWHSAAGGNQWTFIDETGHGGSAFWSFHTQLEEGSYTDRYHLRIFNGGYDDHSGGFDYWSVGAVHRENCTPSCHTHYSNSWETSESHIKSDLSSTSGILSVGSINISNSGYYQGIYNDGYAGLIKVQ